MARPGREVMGRPGHLGAEVSGPSALSSGDAARLGPYGGTEGDMTSHDLKEANQQLLDGAARLVDEWPGLPTGSVLRCFARAVWIVRGTGCPPERLAAEAARLASSLLELRGATGADGATVAVLDLGARVPKQRPGRSAGPGRAADDGWSGQLP